MNPDYPRGLHMDACTFWSSCDASVSAPATPTRCTETSGAKEGIILQSLLSIFSRGFKLAETLRENVSASTRTSQAVVVAGLLQIRKGLPISRSAVTTLGTLRFGPSWVGWDCERFHWVATIKNQVPGQLGFQEGRTATKIVTS